MTTHTLTQTEFLAYGAESEYVGVLRLNRPELHNAFGDLMIAELIKTWQPVVLLVVGLPVHSDGTAHELTHLSQRFARRLQGRFNIKVILQDERYTSQTASAALREVGITGRNQKSMLDQVAAQQILQSFFDEQHAITGR